MISVRMFISCYARRDACNHHGGGGQPLVPCRHDADKGGAWPLWVADPCDQTQQLVVVRATASNGAAGGEVVLFEDSRQTEARGDVKIKKGAYYTTDDRVKTFALDHVRGAGFLGTDQEILVLVDRYGKVYATNTPSTAAPHLAHKLHKLHSNRHGTLLLESEPDVLDASACGAKAWPTLVWNTSPLHHSDGESVSIQVPFAEWAALKTAAAGAGKFGTWPQFLTSPGFVAIAHADACYMWSKKAQSWTCFLQPQQNLAYCTCDDMVLCISAAGQVSGWSAAGERGTRQRLVAVDLNAHGAAWERTSYCVAHATEVGVPAVPMVATPTSTTAITTPPTSPRVPGQHRGGDGAGACQPSTAARAAIGTNRTGTVPDSDAGQDQPGAAGVRIGHAPDSPPGPATQHVCVVVQGSLTATLSSLRGVLAPHRHHASAPANYSRRAFCAGSNSSVTRPFCHTPPLRCLRKPGDTARTCTAWRCCWDGDANPPTVQRYDLSHLPWPVGDPHGSAAAPAWIGIGDAAQELVFKFDAAVHLRARDLDGDGDAGAGGHAAAGVDAHGAQALGGDGHWAYHLDRGTLTQHDAVS